MFIKPSLPGLSSEVVAKANLEYVDGRRALELCGINEPGLLIPYYDIYGDPITDVGGEFHRLRLATPQTDRKYHQLRGTSPHAYLPPDALSLAHDANTIILIEGEKKALSLVGCEGIMPVGLGGFYLFRQHQQLLPEIQSVLEISPQLASYYFLGDRDVAFNYQFSQAACELAQLLQPRTLLVSCLPINAPGKGIDDCKEKWGPDFCKQIHHTLAVHVQVAPDLKPAALAVQLMEIKILSGWKPVPADKDELIRSFAKLAASLNSSPLEQLRVIEKGIEVTEVGRAIFKKLVKGIKIERRLEQDTHVFNSENVIDLKQASGIWVPQVLQIIGPSTYLFNGNLCNYAGGTFRVHNSASLVTQIDRPECCSFVRKNDAGDDVPVSLTEKETRLILGSFDHEHLRVVKVVSPVPVLALTPNGTKLVQGYCPETQIFAGGNPVGISCTKLACQILLLFLSDFDFATAADKGRAIAMILTLALTKGGFLHKERAPFFMVEKNKVGAGGGTLVRLAAALNGVKPVSITPDNPKDAKEDISKHLLQGTRFMYFDNIRGNIMTKLPFFESLLTEPAFTCRAPYLHSSADVTRCVFACTSNGAVLSKDLADRTVRINIRKRPDDYKFIVLGGFNVTEFAARSDGLGLAYIYGLIRDWADKGRPSGKRLTGFRYAEWEGACSWIIENHFPGLSLLDDTHKEAQKRLADPEFELLRAVLRAVIDTGRTDFMSTTEIVRIALNNHLVASDEQKEIQRMGRILSPHIPKEGIFPIADEFLVTRTDSKDAGSNYELMKKYSVALLRPHPPKTLPIN